MKNNHAKNSYIIDISKKVTFIKVVFVILINVLCTQVSATELTQSDVSQTCEEKLFKAIEKEAKRLGLNKEFGFDLFERQHLSNQNSLVFESTIFRINEGYIENSGATIAISKKNLKECKIVNLKVAIGNLTK